MPQVNKFNNREEVMYYGNKVEIIQWQRNPKAIELRYYIRDCKTGREQWANESELSKPNQ